MYTHEMGPLRPVILLSGPIHHSVRPEYFNIPPCPTLLLSYFGVLGEGSLFDQLFFFIGPIISRLQSFNFPPCRPTFQAIIGSLEGIIVVFLLSLPDSFDIPQYRSVSKNRAGRTECPVCLVKTTKRL